MTSKIKLNPNRIPKHIAYIIDGNGRWAKQRNLPRSLGHKRGMQTLKNAIKNAFSLGVQVVSVYGFSTENWKRPQEEIDYLFQLFRKYISKEMDTWVKENIKLNIMGDYTAFPDDLVNSIEYALAETKDNTGNIINLGINYSGKSEIIRAVKSLIDNGVKSIDEHTFERYLYTADLPPLDFVIRTSGEQRLSNFMLWQCAYSELYFPKVLWPDFNKRHLIIALCDYQSRDRRYGAIKER